MPMAAANQSLMRKGGVRNLERVVLPQTLKAITAGSGGKRCYEISCGHFRTIESYQLSKKKKNKLKDKVVAKDSGSGLGLFAKKDFKKDAVIGRIKGKVVSEAAQDPRYVMELGNDMLLVPKEPFRYLNHSCKPNCEIFDWEDEKPDSKTGVKDLYLGVLKNVKAGSELTIDYAWPADFAIPCLCGSKKCRGYIVDKDELHLIA